jgi:hypothetical protein
VEIAHQRHIHAHAVELLANGRHRCRRFGRIDGQPDYFGTGAGQVLDLDRCPDGVGGIGVGLQTSESGKRLVASVVGSVVSVDLADGDPASLTALLTKAGVTVSPAMTAALGVAAVAAAVAVTLVSIRRQLGAQDLEMAAGAGLLVQSYQDALRQAGFSLFDKTMDDVEEQLEARARRFLGVDDRMNAAFRTLAAVKAARACRGQMLGSLHQLSAEGPKGPGG